MLRPRSLVWATEIDVLAADRLVAARPGYLVVREPGNPGHYWGNLLVLRRPPVAGDRPRWEALFDREFADEPGIAHRTFCWDVTDGSVGAAETEFVPRGYDLQRMTGLIASPDDVLSHPRANAEVVVRALDPALGGPDDPLWEQTAELWVSSREASFGESEYRAFTRQRLADLRHLFAAGGGSWYVALKGTMVVGSCGIVVTDGRGRFQAVDTAAAHRRQGICTRLIIDAARHAARVHGARHLVICADPEYHALGIYESLGFQAAEQVAGVCLRPRAAA